MEPHGHTAQLLHLHGQDALLELELATDDMDAHERWMVEQLLLTYVADSVPGLTWSAGIDVGVRAVLRSRLHKELADLDAWGGPTPE